MKLINILTSILAWTASISGGRSLECPQTKGYTFLPLRRPAYAKVLQELDGFRENKENNNQDKVIQALAHACDQDTRNNRARFVQPCNAFLTSGQLLSLQSPAGLQSLVSLTELNTNISSLNNNLTIPMDTSSEDIRPCDGTYVSVAGPRSGFGLDTRNVQQGFEDIGRQVHRQTMAVAVLTNKIRKSLKESKPNADDIRKAARDLGIPLSDRTAGYTESDMIRQVLSVSIFNGYPTSYSTNYSTSYPTSYPYITSVKDQGSCGSCVAFAAIATAEASIGYATKTANNVQDLSEQWLFFCNGMYYPSCSTGWWPGDAAQVIRTSSCPYEKCHPYVAAPSCSSPACSTGITNARPNGTFNVVTFSSTEIQLAKDFIAAGGAVMSFFSVYEDFFGMNPTSGIYKYDGFSAYAGGHEVSVIGYNDIDGYWVIKNSWGTGWGEYGFAKVGYGQVGLMSGVSGNIIGFSFVPYSPSPTVSPSPTPSPTSTPRPTPSPTPRPTSTPRPTPRPTPGPTSTPRPTCGDTVCSDTETCSTCAKDCGPCAVCGDRVCNAAESCYTCAADCGSCCGNKVCDSLETCANCPTDCGSCKTCNNDKICGPLAETCGTCPGDCGKCNGKAGYCGDGKCQFSFKRGSWSETKLSCPRDCVYGDGRQFYSVDPNHNWLN